jgi:hypothetical protein
VKQIFIAVLLAFLPLVVWAADNKQDEVPTDVQTMDVNGTVVVSADGSVRKYTIDDAKKLSQLSPAVLEFVQRTIQAWKFEPQKTKHDVKLRAYMRLIASQREDGDIDIRMAGVNVQSWTDGNVKITAGQDVNTMRMPREPNDLGGAMTEGGSGSAPPNDH